MAEANTLRRLSDDQLIDELATAHKELFNLRFQFATSQNDNSAQLTTTKRDVARIKTVLREREIAAAEMVAAAANGAAASAAVSEPPTDAPAAAEPAAESAAEPEADAAAAEEDGDGATPAPADSADAEGDDATASDDADATTDSTEDETN